MTARRIHAEARGAPRELSHLTPEEKLIEKRRQSSEWTKERLRTDPEYRKKINAKARARAKKYKESGHVKPSRKDNSIVVGYNRKRMYGITPQAYQAMLDGQNYKCKICGTLHRDEKFKGLCVDHCHESGMVRALLCNQCNRALGLFKDNLEIVRNAAAYLAQNHYMVLEQPMIDALHEDAVRRGLILSYTPPRERQKTGPKRNPGR